MFLSEPTTDDLRTRWEMQRAKDLGIIHYGPTNFTVDGKPTQMYSVVDMAILYGLEPSDIITFTNSWAKIKSELKYCKDFRVFCQSCTDYIPRKLFDHVVAPIINSTFAISLVESQLESRNDTSNDEQEQPQPTEQSRMEEEEPSSQKQTSRIANLPINSSIEDPSTEDPSTQDPSTQDPSTKDPSTKDPSTKDPLTEATTEDHLIVVSQMVSPMIEMAEQNWNICAAKKLEHERLLRSMGNSRGNYIAQIGPLDFKFGSTDRSILDRTTEHVKDFPHFYLIFAEHCANTSMAESHFRSDALIKKRRKTVRTERNNHTEVVSIDTDVTEFTLKNLYLKYIQQVDAQERFVLNAKYAVVTANEMENASNASSTPHAVSTQIQVQDSPATSSVIAQSMVPTGEIKRKIDLEVLKLVQDHEFRMKKLEWEQTKWSAMHVAGFKFGNEETILKMKSLPSVKDTHDTVCINDKVSTTSSTTALKSSTPATTTSTLHPIIDDVDDDNASELSDVPLEDDVEIVDHGNDGKEEEREHVSTKELKRPCCTRSRQSSSSTADTTPPPNSKKSKTKASNHDDKDVYVSPPLPTQTGGKKQLKRRNVLLKISTFNERPTAEFKSIREAANSCRTYEYRRLANAIKTGIPYKSYRWRLVQQPVV